MFWLGLTVGVITGMALGIILAALVLDEKKDNVYKCEIEEIWLDGRNDK